MPNQDSNAGANGSLHRQVPATEHNQAIGSGLESPGCQGFDVQDVFRIKRSGAPPAAHQEAAAVEHGQAVELVLVERENFKVSGISADG